MKLTARLSGLDHALSMHFDDGSESFATAEVDGRSYEIEVRELNQGQYLLLVGSRVYKARVAPGRDSSGPAGSFDVSLGGSNYYITVIDPKRLRSAQTNTAADTGAAQIVSPMPGKLVRVLVQPGAQVAAGDGIVVVEAMKMQNEMKSPKAGIVVSINAETGATVSAGDVLAVIE